MKDWARPKVYLNNPSEKKTSSGDQIVWKFKRTSYKLRNVAITDQRAALGTDLAAGEITALLWQDNTLNSIFSIFCTAESTHEMLKYYFKATTFPLVREGVFWALFFIRFYLLPQSSSVKQGVRLLKIFPFGKRIFLLCPPITLAGSLLFFDTSTSCHQNLFQGREVA